MGQPTTRRTLLEAVTYFADPNRAHEYVVRWRWPNGVACPRKGCGSAAVQFIATRKKWRCKECKRQFSVKVGTIFEDSPIPFTKWLPAFWLLANTKNGTSSHELSRALGGHAETAWFMFHRIRLTMKAESLMPLSGEVEADETFVGGKTRATMVIPGERARKLAHGPATGKATVFGMIQRGEAKGKSRVRAMVVPNHKASSLIPRIYENVVPGSTLYAREDDDSGRFRHRAQRRGRKAVDVPGVTSSHPRWRLQPGHVARAAARRREPVDPNIVTGVSDRI